MHKLVRGILGASAIVAGAAISLSAAQAADYAAGARRHSAPQADTVRHRAQGCPDAYTCYGLYGGYGPWGGTAYWSHYSRQVYSQPTTRGPVYYKR